MDGLILIDKQVGATSYDAVRLVKRLFNTNKVGHCGTLDPFASGLLIIGINQAIYNPDNNISNIGIGFAIPINIVKEYLNSVDNT